jgi:hypothetical protein
VALGQVFSECFGFSRQPPHRLLHTNHRLSSRAGKSTMGQTVVDVPSGLSLTPSQKYIKKLKTPWPESASELYRPSYRH